MKNLLVVLGLVLLGVGLIEAAFSVSTCLVNQAEVTTVPNYRFGDGTLGTAYIPVWYVNLSLPVGSDFNTRASYANTTCRQFQTYSSLGYTNQTSAQNELNSYAIGSTTICYYDSSVVGGNPSWSNPNTNLVVGPNNDKVIFILLGVFMAIACFPITLLILIVVLAVPVLIVLAVLAVIFSPCILAFWLIRRGIKQREMAKREYEMSPITVKQAGTIEKMNELNREGSGSYLSLLPGELMTEVVKYVESANSWNKMISDNDVHKPASDDRAI
eukprot:TRINITY_DN2883_c0_g2_i1.p1 TRINITY_DN2883_c0_g2~~TRINITY_DN2883_c0_g2_i1.p1  ORF type:complete len:272 (-),score=41.05 TRINITY_DN2883_c0_g2_i1:94-909(-)